MASTIDLVPWAFAHLRPLQRALLSRWKPVSRDFQAVLPIPSSTVRSLRWWLDPHRLARGGVPGGPGLGDRHHGRQPGRLGSSLSRQLDPGPVVGGAVSLCHQLAGGQGGPSSSAGILPIGAPSGGQSSVGQRDHGGIHQSPGGHEKSSRIFGDRQADGVGGTPPTAPGGFIHRGCRQRTGGLPQPTTLGSRGVGTLGDGNGSDSQALGDSTHGSHGNCQKCKGCSLLQSQKGTRRGRGRCAGPPVAASVSPVCLSTVATGGKGYQKNRGSSGASNSRGAGVAQAAVVRRSPPCGGGSASSRSSATSPPSSSNIFRSGRSLLSCGLAFERRKLRRRGYPEPAISTLLRARNTSTSVTYVWVWKVFEEWCDSHTIQSTQASVAQILFFLQAGLDLGMAYNSLRVQVAALGAFLQGGDDVLLSSHPDILRFLKGVRHLKPPIRPPCPSWNLNLVLRALCSPPFKPLGSASIKDVALKTIFLVVISSARRISELQALSCREPYLRFSVGGVSLSTVPSFLPKVVSAFHLNQSVELPSFSSSDSGDLCKLDSAAGIVAHLEITNDFRLSDHLLVFWSGPRKGCMVSKQSIAHWLKGAIVAAYLCVGKSPPLAVKAHSLRSQSTSWAESTLVSVQEICRAATWKSLHTFAKHHRLDVRASVGGHFGDRVLCAGLSSAHP
ncbi:uncharacterized protein LOC115081586 [Rhinatrema bivittatum]|uniref:uncharacterized protein LOC115081586 n=1 Tax=Rhinatrema bivittatum TaxID=194408 RepID=UPI00112DE490|nr:uncharacterized protein LOC115081586 [Rhinatrema bivittatum]